MPAWLASERCPVRTEWKNVPCTPCPWRLCSLDWESRIWLRNLESTALSGSPAFPDSSCLIGSLRRKSLWNGGLADSSLLNGNKQCGADTPLETKQAVSIGWLKHTIYMGFHILLGTTGDSEVSLSFTTCFEEKFQINHINWTKFHPISKYASSIPERAVA